MYRAMHTAAGAPLCRGVLLLWLLLAFAGAATAAPKPVPTPADAVRWADADAAGLPQGQSPFVRYLFDQDKDGRWHQNYVLFMSVFHADSPQIFTPKDLPGAWTACEPVLGSAGYLYRVDFSLLCPDIEERTRVLLLWDNLAVVNGYFNLITKEVILRPVPRYWDKKAGKFFTSKWLPVVVPARHLGGVDDPHLLRYKRLLTNTASPNPIMHSRHALRLLWSTINGGIYYDVRGIDRKPAKGTAEQAWLARVGLNPNVRASREERAGFDFSGVTAGPRVVEWHPITQVPASLGQGLVFITRDFIELTDDPQRLPGYNVLRNYEPGANTHDATEAIALGRGGEWEGVLFNGDGDLQDEAPGNVVSDRRVPNPHPTRLQGIISCVRCHAEEDGFRTGVDEVSEMLRNGINIYGDLKDPKDIRAQHDDLASKYAGDMLPVLEAARRTHREAVFWVTAGNLTVKAAGTSAANAYDEFFYGPTGRGYNVRDALYQLGFDCDTEDEARQLYATLLPPLPKNELQFSPESYVVGRLRIKGWYVSPITFQAEYSTIANRILETRLLRAAAP